MKISKIVVSVSVSLPKFPNKPILMVNLTMILQAIWYLEIFIQRFIYMCIFLNYIFSCFYKGIHVYIVSFLLLWILYIYSGRGKWSVIWFVEFYSLYTNILINIFIISFIYYIAFYKSLLWIEFQMFHIFNISIHS
jgi:hypothetical protein